MPHSIEEYPTRRNGNAFFVEMYYLLTNIKCCFFPIIYSPSHEEDHGRVPTSSEELGEEDGDNDPDRFSPEVHSSQFHSNDIFGPAIDHGEGVLQML